MAEEAKKFSIKNLTKTQKILGIAGIAVALVAFCGLVVGVVMYMFVLPPSANKVCKHVIDLAVTYYEDEWDMSKSEAMETVEDAMGTVKECAEDLKKEREGDTWKKQREDSKCILDAKEFEDIFDCAMDLE
ncbi:hypothetical protein JW962_02640 [Candidatus Dojkabacteria bacterium]|nr:hypothetical protein [Candidatus Dojkabacteria bacterium]